MGSILSAVRLFLGAIRLASAEVIKREYLYEMNERQRKILKILQRGKLEIKSTAVYFKVSEMTIRRDLQYLSSRKLLLQVKGGAVGSTVRYEPDAVSGGLNEQKFSIGESLYARIMPCESIFLGTGSTVLAFAKVLAGKFHPPLTVITNALPVASTLFQTNCKVILLGGDLRGTSLDLVGPLAEANIEQYHVDWLVSGCDGALCETGFFTSDFSLSNLEKKSIGIASRVAIICESSKFGQQSLTCFVKPEKVQLLVTDSRLPACQVEKLRQAEIEVILCD